MVSWRGDDVVFLFFWWKSSTLVLPCFAKAKQESANPPQKLVSGKSKLYGFTSIFSLVRVCVCQNTGFLSNLPYISLVKNWIVDHIYPSSFVFLMAIHSRHSFVFWCLIPILSKNDDVFMPLRSTSQSAKDLRKERRRRRMMPTKVMGRNMRNLTLNRRMRLTNTGLVDGGYGGGWWILVTTQCVEDFFGIHSGIH